MAFSARRAVAGAAGAASRPSVPIGSRSTAQELRAAGIGLESPSERFRDEVLQRIAALGAKGFDAEAAAKVLLPHTVLSSGTLADVVTALVSGAHLLFFGPSGAGKTSLAKDLWELFPKDAWVIEGCPVLDHPLSVCDAAVAERAPPCPICRRRFSPDSEVARFDPTRVDPAKVPAILVRLREGYGYARVQGSSEVFPDHLTGNINLRKLEEIGDPMSPLVLAPGKLLQANRGVLLVDEIGKLPLGTQNVLLQALQEGTVTPSKSRETFPAAFVAICTSNLSDLDNINDPLSDRLTSILIGFNRRHADNRRIVDRGQALAPGEYVPEVLIDAGVRVIETWRLKAGDDNPDTGEVGSNRTLLDVAARTRATATLAGREVPTADDLKSGLLHAMRGRIRARSGDSFQQNARRITEFVEQYTEPAIKRSAGVYWCRFFRTALRENAKDGEAVVSEGRRLQHDAGLRGELDGGAALFPKFQLFRRWVGETEPLPAPLSATDASLAVFDLLDRHSLFSCTEADVDDDAGL